MRLSLHRLLPQDANVSLLDEVSTAALDQLMHPILDMAHRLVSDLDIPDLVALLPRRRELEANLVARHDIQSVLRQMTQMIATPN